MGGNFGLSGPSATATAYTSDDCYSVDYLLIPNAGASAGATTSYDRFCGSLFAMTSSSNTGVTLYTTIQPFVIGVYTNGVELNPADSTAEASTGFYLYYKQTAC